MFLQLFNAQLNSILKVKFFLFIEVYKILFCEKILSARTSPSPSIGTIETETVVR